ncbi:NAD(P)-dependent oxidoreductase [Mariniblastus sp.]|nr:NAD(P)-dependent oxidoreductase [Mariniblastus sp.]
MRKIAIVGGNGQVGAEICLILNQLEGINVIPICRNRFGSAFLRYNGIACRHGSIANASQAEELIGDCDLVVNFAFSLGGGRPREQRKLNNTLINSVAKFSQSSATVIYFSTQSIYGDPSPNAKWRWKSLYAKEKLKCEKDAIRAGKRHSKDTFVFRIGHVVGELQGLTNIIRDEIRSGCVDVPITNRGSNTVYTATIAEAIFNISMGKESSGVYDLMNVPQWDWRKVYAREAKSINAHLEFSKSNHNLGSSSSVLRSPVKGLLKWIAKNPTYKQYGLRILSSLPSDFSSKIQATHFANNAKREIGILKARPPVNEKLLRVEEGSNFLPSLSKTTDLLNQPCFQALNETPSKRWPDTDSKTSNEQDRNSN